MYRGLKVLDGHADILYRMETEGLSFYDVDSKLHQSAAKLQKSGIDVQVFVTFVDPSITPSEQLYKVLSSLHRFHADVEKSGSVELVTTFGDIDRLIASRTTGAILSLEGADAINGQIAVLHALYRLGIRWIGLTWNGANSLADGVGEERGAGLTNFGKEAVQEMQRLGMVVDVSHLAWSGVEDVLSLTQKPIVASDSNAYSVYPHRRNLPDELIQGIVHSGGTVGVTFVPHFIGGKEGQSIDDLILHMEHLLRVAGPDGVALGSDFDGITETLVNLKNGEDYPALLDRLIDEFGMEIAKKVAGENLLRVLRNTIH